MASKASPDYVHESPYSVDLDIPTIDVPSYIFSQNRQTGGHVTRYIDAAAPSHSYDLDDALLSVKRFAKGLQNSGIKPGSRVLLYSGNQLYFPIVLWGVIAAQCVFTAASQGASVFELSHQLKDSGVVLVLASQDRVESAQKAASAAGLDPSCVYAFTKLNSTTSRGSATGNVPDWTELWAPTEEASMWSWQTITTLKEASETTAVMNYSSGTTGLPKGVELTHYNLIANTEQLVFKRGLVADSDLGRQRSAALAETGERWLAPLPMYHAFGQTYYSLLAPRVGARVYIIEKFNSFDYLHYIDMFRITFINVVPTILKTLTRVPKPELFNLKSVSMVGSGAAPLDLEVARRFERTFLRPGVQIKQGWGMTETTVNVTGFAPDDVDDGKSIGWLNPGCKARIVPVQDREASGSERDGGRFTGEIWVSGPNIMKGYWEKSDETRKTIVEQKRIRWLKTGDIGYFDDRGCLFIVDRLKELIKVKGLQVSPAELEHTLSSYPGIVDAAVTCVQINGRDCPRAFVVKDKPSVTAGDLHLFIKGRLASHKWLTGGIYFLDALPRTGSGKVIKRELPDPDKRISKL